MCKLIGERPECAPILLRELLGMDLPADLKLVPAPETIRELSLPEHAADVVVANRRAAHGSVLESFVFEVQLQRDSDKAWSWPIHVAGLRSRLQCPTTLVVVTKNERTARWAAKPIDLGRGQMVLRPLVIGPKQIPHMLELDEARRYPELATLAVIVHGRKSGSKRLGRNALEAVLERLDAGHERDTLLLDLIMAFLSKAMLEELEEQMELQSTQRFSAFAKQHFAEGLHKGRQEGLHKGRQEALLLVLSSRGLTLSSAERQRVDCCTDAGQLDEWLRRAVAIESVEQLFVTPRSHRSRRRSSTKSG